ncbi:hypothetical protein G7054_g10370 [Neopestalotiopsis clavispora]|nr:hypothetical protein G7054_g10370 [Neopestalotiopsis clavispora]
MENLTESAALPDASVSNMTDSKADSKMEEIELASSDGTQATTTCDHENSILNCCRPDSQAAVTSAGQDEQLNDDFQATLRLVSNSIKQVADGLGEMVAVVIDIRDSVKPKGEESDSTNTSSDPSGGSEDTKKSKDSSGDSGGSGRPGDLAAKKQEDAESVSDRSEYPTYQRLPFPKNVIPEIRFCDSGGFNESFSGEETGHCVEVLRVGDDDVYDKLTECFNTELKKARQVIGDQNEGTRSRWIDRVRVQSRFVMKRLDGCYKPYKDHIFGEFGPVVFKRPFTCFIYFQNQMKNELKELEKEVAASILRAEQAKETVQEESGKTASSDETRTDNRSGNPPDLGRDGENNDPEKTRTLNDDLQLLQHELEEVRCYVEFVDTHIMPLHNPFDLSNPSRPQKIRYQDLWYLFKLGELIYQPPRKKNSPMALSGQSRTSATRQTLWRMYRMVVTNTESDTYIWCYHIDFDGVSYGASVQGIVIEEFEGERDITSLSCYPLSYAKDATAILKSAREDGSKFMALVTDKNKHGTHAGWTLTDDPQGNPVEVSNFQGEKIKLNPEHIESDVVFDFNEACNFHPSWAPKFGVESPVMIDTEGTFIGPAYVKWANEERLNRLATYSQRIVTVDEVFNIEHNRFLEQDHYFSEEKMKVPVSDDDLVLLPKRMFGYALWERKFVIVNVRNVEQKLDDKKENPFDKLEIEDGHKKMIQAIISSYFANKRLEDEIRAPLTQDLIRGKGKGVVILLHGLPGVGKTATAEAVAQKWKKPLFPITCGDLGDTAASVEKTLNDIFRFAHLWECVLLLDEADVFITQRSKEDLRRNALVSVFLRMLEYYNGVLFLTTNRPGVLDEAVKSRVHLSLRYEALTLEQTKAIFKLNIERLKQIEEQRNKADIERNRKQGILSFAEDHWKKHTNDLGRWNGRQIRNAFSIAASLAHFVADEEPELELPRFLSAEQFREVQEATLLYDQYRHETLQQTDSERALTFEERSDKPTSSS